jgi:hypothetical protein
VEWKVGREGGREGEKSESDRHISLHLAIIINLISLDRLFYSNIKLSLLTLISQVSASKTQNHRRTHSSHGKESKQQGPNQHTHSQHTQAHISPLTKQGKIHKNYLLR